MIDTSQLDANWRQDNFVLREIEFETTGDVLVFIRMVDL